MPTKNKKAIPVTSFTKSNALFSPQQNQESLPETLLPRAQLEHAQKALKKNPPFLEEDKSEMDQIDEKLIEERQWIPLGSLKINIPLFKEGVLYLVPKNFKDENCQVSEKKIPYHNQTLECTTFKPNKNNKKSAMLYHKLQDNVFSSCQSIRSKEDAIPRIFPHSSKNAEMKVMINTKRREETFFPLGYFYLSPNSPSQHAGLYVYPWINGKISEDKELKKFTRFIMPHCIPGIIGIDKKGHEIELIQHNIQFQKEQKIVALKATPSFKHPYDYVNHVEFFYLICLMNHLAHPQERNLILHLPTFDYVLFGIRLFIEDRLSRNALYQLYKIVKFREENYLIQKAKICALYNFTIESLSPFDNLLPPRHFAQNQIQQLEDENRESFKEKTVIEDELTLLLHVLQVPTNPPKNSSESQEYSEKTLVKRCLDLLINNNYYPRHQKAWKEAQPACKDIQGLEALFKIANTVVLCIGAQATGDYQTCAIYENTEKQILLNHSKCQINGQLTATEKIFYINYLQTVVAHLEDKQNSLFYIGTNTGIEYIPDNLFPLLIQESLKNIALNCSNKKEETLKKITPEEPLSQKAKPKIVLHKPAESLIRQHISPNLRSLSMQENTRQKPSKNGYSLFSPVACIELDHSLDTQQLNSENKSSKNVVPFLIK